VVFVDVNLDISLPKQATFEGAIEQSNVFGALERWSKMVTPGWLMFEPSNLGLRLHRGAIVGAQGAEPLGTILVGQGILSETELSAALQSRGEESIGTVLTRPPFEVPEVLIKDCLRQQIEAVVDRLLAEPQKRFKFYRADSPSGMYVRLELQTLRERKQHLHFDSDLPLEETFRMAMMPDESQITLSLDDWRVCRLLSGRRTLRQILDRASSDHDGYAQAYKSLERLMARGLLELSSVSGLRTIFLRRKRAIPASYHPPAGMVANLFLKQLDGSKSCRQIGDELAIDPDKIALIVAGLYRDRVVDVIQGATEIQRLLEDY
jgi:hypothetical protein